MEKQLTTGVVAGFGAGIGSRLRAKVAFYTGAAALALAGLAGVTSATAQSTLLVDRGLPTINLNGLNDPNRSNVAWAQSGYTAADYWLVGDTFTNTSSQTWNIDTIRLWTVGGAGTATLWGGIEGSTIGLVPGSGAISSATYANGNNYIGYSGTSRPMQQVDFSVNITLAPGQTYDFFLDGTGGLNTVPSAHASNAALSGSPQIGADGLMLEGEVVNGSFVQGSVGTWSSTPVSWDKVSDVNVQVMGAVAAVPEPETFAMLLAGLGLLGYVGHRRQQKEAAAA